MVGENMSYFVHQIDPMAHIDLLHYMNAFEPERFPELQSKHFARGFWWIAQEYDTNYCIAFAGLVPFDPFPGVGYLKRAYVLPQYRGQGLQLSFMRLRERKARELGWHMLVSECKDNPRSEDNFIRAGFKRCDPEQPWGEPGSVYFMKQL